MMKILDTNVLIRFLVADNRKQQKKAEEWFRQAQRGELDIVVDSIVIAESCFVLESVYKLERINISDSLQVFLSQRWLKVENREILLNLWVDYLLGFHFVDSYLMARAKLTGGEILSFDKKAQKRFAKFS